MNLVIEVRQFVFARPVPDLVLVAARPTVAVRSVAVVIQPDLLVLAFQLVLENDTSNLEVGILVSKAGLS